MGRYPYGGVLWCSLMYLLGLRQLGHRVWYLEDTGECNIDPERNTLSEVPSYALRVIGDTLRAFGLEERWCYIDHGGSRHGPCAATWKDVCRHADMLITLSGGCWFWRDEYLRIPRKVYIDSDPVFTQRRLRGDASLGRFFGHYDALFTFGRNIGTDRCDESVGDTVWHHTWQPVVLDAWTPLPQSRHRFFTTVMTWQIESFREIGGNKDIEFRKVEDLPARTSIPLELAISSTEEIAAQLPSYLHSRGWRVRPAFDVSKDIDRYRDYLRNSLGEFSVAKHLYVAAHSGWFSDRTACYLASGRPAVVQDTGFSAHLPTGNGLLAFTTVEEAVAALEEAAARYERHRRAARELAAAEFSSSLILTRLLEQVWSSDGCGSASLDHAG